MDVILRSVLPFLGMLVVLIVVHELGHFITAKLAGVKVLEFGLGYPPRLWGVKRGETEYTVNALPLGGFVRLLGEEDPSDARSLAAKPRWVRLIVLASGSGMNVVLAVFLISVALMIPREVDISRARIGEVVPNSPAEEAGLRPGDIIFAVNGTNVNSVGELGYQIRLNLGKTIDMRVKANQVPGRELDDPDGDGFVEFPVYARWSADPYLDENGIERAQGPTGITIGPAYGAIAAIPPEEQEELRLLLLEEHGLSPEDELPPGVVVPTTRLVPFSETQWAYPWTAVVDGAKRSWESLVIARNEIISRIKGGVGGGSGFQVTGPVGIAQLTGEVVDEAGWKSLMEFAALISMNLAVLNILPLPMLDGGRVVFVLLEIARGGRRVSPEREAMVHFIGMVVLLSIAVVITFFDVARIFEGEGILR
jgi:regulator of sigma E protease